MKICIICNIMDLNDDVASLQFIKLDLMKEFICVEFV